ncbi:MAG: SDR family NAD(P)-dependent oxidoreductase, partial [Oliverpabstia sp.]
MDVLITGTSSGIGKGTAEYFLKEGHTVYGFDKKISAIRHKNYIHYCLDIREEASYPRLPDINVIINNAGVQNQDDIEVNLKGTISITEHYGIQSEIRSIIMI